MDKIKLVLAVWIAKLAALILRLFRFRATATPGKYALMICPKFLSLSAMQVKRKIVVVCGTNGKTTTNNLIASAAEDAGFKVVCNHEGANMINGIATAFVKNMDLLARLDCDFACIEADEATLPLLFDHFAADIILVTNLFCDQLDRYGEIDTAFCLLSESFLKSPEATYILNADDPVTSVFGRGRRAYYYGLSENPDMLTCRELRDGDTCRVCRNALTYEHYHYGQLGCYRCAGCGYQNPDISFGASKISIADGSLDFDIIENDAPGQGEAQAHIHSDIAALYHVYNMLAAFSALVLMGIDKNAAFSALGSYKPEPGRMSRIKIGTKLIYLVLSKNPTGFNQSIAAVLNDSREKDIMLALNDNVQDGEDVSWIWDVDFETLVLRSQGKYTVTGARRYDMALRLKYAGAGQDSVTIADDAKSAVLAMLDSGKNVYYVLANYTAMHPVYMMLLELEKEGVK